MARRTISNLSRELGVSRPRIYRALGRLGIGKKAGGEFPLGEWEALKTELMAASEHNKEKVIDAARVEKAGEEAIRKNKPALKSMTGLGGIGSSTIKERLGMAKREYDYNRGLIVGFQREIDEYMEANEKTTARSHNGTETAIPQINSLEKYTKLNITLSRLINDLESDLDLSEEEENPFE